MRFQLNTAWRLCILVTFSLVSGISASAASRDLGNGFLDHGVCVPISNHRGTVAAVDGQGKDVLLVLLMDHRGGYELLMLDASSGKSQEFSMPFPPSGEIVDSPYSSLLSSKNKYYTHYNGYFVEFDPAKPGFTFCRQTSPQLGMGLCEDDQGVIWSVAYPQSSVVSFDPKTQEFHDYGPVYYQDWAMYPKFIADDDAGWIYFALGHTASQIVAFNPKTSQAKPIFKAEERKKGLAYLYRDLDGKVYGQPLKGENEPWYELYQGNSRKLDSHKKMKPRPAITGDQTLIHAKFPDGKKLKSCNLVDRKLIITSADGKDEIFDFDYVSEGADLMGVGASPDHTASGGTTFPMRFFSYNPKTDTIIHRAAYGQWNTIATQGDHFFAGTYPGGALVDWNPAETWVTTEKTKANGNPKFLIDCDPTIHRPGHLQPLNDGRTIVMSGTPDYGYTGGGLLFWDRETSAHVLLTDAEVIPDQSTMSMACVPNNLLLGGTTTSPGTGGQKKATQAELYLMNADTKKVIWHEAPLPGVQEYTALCPGEKGLVYGFADRKTFFVFDSTSRKIVLQRDTEKQFGLCASQQGPRPFAVGSKGEIYVLFKSGPAGLNVKNHELKLIAKTPVPMDGGGDYLDGRLYFYSGSHLYSYTLPK